MNGCGGGRFSVPHNQNRQGRPATVAGVQGIAMRKASRLQALALAADGGGVAWTTSLMRRMHSVSAPALGACAASPTLQHAHQQTDGGPSWRSKFAAAAVGLAAALASGSLVVHGDASRAAPTSTGPTTGEQLAQLHEWLAAQGADVSRVQVRASQAGWRHLTRARRTTLVETHRTAVLGPNGCILDASQPRCTMANSCAAGPKGDLP